MSFYLDSKVKTMFAQFLSVTLKTQTRIFKSIVITFDRLLFAGSLPECTVLSLRWFWLDMVVLLELWCMSKAYLVITSNSNCKGKRLTNGKWVETSIYIVCWAIGVPNFWCLPTIYHREETRHSKGCFQLVRRQLSLSLVAHGNPKAAVHVDLACFAIHWFSGMRKDVVLHVVTVVCSDITRVERIWSLWGLGCDGVILQAPSSDARRLGGLVLLWPPSFEEVVWSSTVPEMEPCDNQRALGVEPP